MISQLAHVQMTSFAPVMIFKKLKNEFLVNFRWSTRNASTSRCSTTDPWFWLVKIIDCTFIATLTFRSWEFNYVISEVIGRKNFQIFFFLLFKEDRHGIFFLFGIIRNFFFLISRATQWNEIFFSIFFLLILIFFFFFCKKTFGLLANYLIFIYFFALFFFGVNCSFFFLYVFFCCKILVFFLSFFQA